jgi:dolichol-phosphate mannosyltransferase
MQPELITQVDDGFMGAASALAHRLRLPTTLIKFVMVGGLAFVVYQLFLYLLYDSPVFWFLPDKDTDANLIFFTHPDVRLLISSIVAVELAIVMQFNSHERWTFRHRPRDGWIALRFVKFNMSSIVSPVIIVVTTNVLTLTLDVSPYISSIVGVAIGFMWNWTMTSLVIWPKAGLSPMAMADDDQDFRAA